MVRECGRQNFNHDGRREDVVGRIGCTAKRSRRRVSVFPFTDHWRSDGRNSGVTTEPDAVRCS